MMGLTHEEQVIADALAETGDPAIAARRAGIAAARVRALLNLTPHLRAAVQTRGATVMRFGRGWWITPRPAESSKPVTWSVKSLSDAAVADLRDRGARVTPHADGSVLIVMPTDAPLAPAAAAKLPASPDPDLVARAVHDGIRDALKATWGRR